MPASRDRTAPSASTSEPAGPAASRLVDVLDRPDSLWNRAAQASPQGDPFCCRTEWQLSLQEAFFPSRRLVIRHSQDALLALAERRHPDLGPTLEPLDALWLFGSPLLGSGAIELLATLLAERACEGREPSVILSGVLPHGALREQILRRFQADHAIFRIKTVEVCHASLEGGLAGYLSRRSPLHRKRLRQAERRARARGVRFERVAPGSAVEADACFARMLAVEVTSWKGLARRGMEEPAPTAFYSAMARRLAVSRSCRAVFARIDDRDIGYVLGGIAGPVYRGQQFSYAHDWRDFSIGNLLQREQIAWLAEEGIERYDMGPLMDYKPHWAETCVAMETLLLRPRTPLQPARGPAGRARVSREGPG